MFDISVDQGLASGEERVPFDFSAHRRAAAQAYQTRRSLYLAFSETVRRILGDALASRHIKVSSLEARAKDVASFAQKASAPSDDDPNRPKYPTPLTDITDLVGVRVIGFLPRTVTEVGAVVMAEFEVLEQVDKGDALRRVDRFGYQSVHYLVRLRDNRTALPEYERYRGLVAEVQVRTTLQHAWAEIEHDIQYKSADVIPVDISRRFSALAGLLELADREFQAIQDADHALRTAAHESVEKGELDEVELTPYALKAYLDKRLGQDRRMTDFSYEYETSTLRGMGFVTLDQIEECISAYDDDTVWRALWGRRVRQGQLTRFEAILLAGMGDNLITLHPRFRGERWFVSANRAKLDRLRTAGIQVGSYAPQ